VTDTKKDLVILAADMCIGVSLEGLLSRRQSLQIREVTCDILVHPDKDPGCVSESASFLRPFLGQYAYALVVFDLVGCGRESEGREAVESDVESGLAKNGWVDRAKAVAVVPEIEAWVWSDSPEVDHCLGWSGRLPTLRQWLVQQRLCSSEDAKPEDPKRAMRLALREVGEAFSSSIFGCLARSVGINRCNDPSFLALKTTLARWFGEDSDTQHKAA